MVAQVQQIRSLLECVWPASLDTARYPFRSKTWAAMIVICDRDGGDLARTRQLGLARFDRTVRREIGKRGGKKPSLRILRALFAAPSDPAGVLAHRRGALERVQLLLEDWHDTRRKLADTEQRMTAVLDELELTANPRSCVAAPPPGAPKEEPSLTMTGAGVTSFVTRNGVNPCGFRHLAGAAV